MRLSMWISNYYSLFYQLTYASVAWIATIEITHANTKNIPIVIVTDGNTPLKANQRSPFSKQALLEIWIYELWPGFQKRKYSESLYLIISLKESRVCSFTMPTSN